MDKITKTRFNKAPTLTKGRTRFDLSHEVLTTFNTGDLVPIFAEPVYPGETHSLRTASLTRLETSLHQTMDNAYLEFAYFFVPSHLVMDDFFKLLGANDDPWTQTVSYTVPQINLSNGSNTGSVAVNSLLNHLALPAGSYGVLNGGQLEELSIDALPLRSVFQAYNDWYRDENYDSIIYFSKGNSDINLSSTFLFNGVNFNPSTDALHVNRFKDVFSTALPAPQKGQEVYLSLGQSAPVVGGVSTHSTKAPWNLSDYGLLFSTSGGSYGNLGTINSSGKVAVTGSGAGSGTSIAYTNLEVDLTGATAVTVNNLRLAIVRQAMKERDARAGTRINEKIYSVFGVKVNDLEVERSEFLGGKRIPISMMEVLQTSETGSTVLGTDAGHSKTLDSDDSFLRSFTQHGWIIGFCYVRTSRSYSQGIDRKFRNKDAIDLVDPMLDNVGEVDIKKSEIYALGTNSAGGTATANGAWGYQEQYYWVKERTNRFSGYFQPGITGTLDSWHYGDNYASMPQMSAGWLKEDANQVDRTIAVSSGGSNAFQWSINVHFEYYATRTLAKYSIPNTFGF